MEANAAPYCSRHFLSESYTVRETKSFVKWESMYGRGLEWFLLMHPQTYKRRLRRGTYQQFRWEAWKAMLRWRLTRERLARETARQTTSPLTKNVPAFPIYADDLDGFYPPKPTTLDSFSSITLSEYKALSEQTSSFSALIKIDVPRTFPELSCFTFHAQSQLSRILNAYANYRPVVGYCQGMNFVVGFILLVSNFRELESFQFLVGFMESYSLEGMFREHFPLLKKYVNVFDSVMEQLAPELHGHFVREGILPPVYLHQWFLTLFVRGLPLSTVVVIWDYLIADGFPSIVGLTVALLRVLQRFLLYLSFEDVIKFLKSLKSSGDCDQSRIGRMLVRQADAMQIPEHFLISLRRVNVEELAKECAAKHRNRFRSEDSAEPLNTFDPVAEDVPVVETKNPVLHYLEEVLQQGNPDTEDATPSNTLKLLVSNNETQNARPEQDAENYSFYSTPRNTTYPFAVVAPPHQDNSPTASAELTKRQPYPHRILGSRQPAQEPTTTSAAPTTHKWLYADSFWRFPYYRSTRPSYFVNSIPARPQHISARDCYSVSPSLSLEQNSRKIMSSSQTEPSEVIHSKSSDIT